MTFVNPDPASTPTTGRLINLQRQAACLTQAQLAERSDGLEPLELRAGQRQHVGLEARARSLSGAEPVASDSPCTCPRLTPAPAMTAVKQ